VILHVKINADERYSDSHCVQPANIQQQATGVTRAFSSALNACTDNSNHDILKKTKASLYRSPIRFGKKHVVNEVTYLTKEGWKKLYSKVQK
jgi:hypothetical protein